MRALRWLLGTAALFGMANVVPGGGAGSFDRLNERDRAALTVRFTKEVWPLLARGGKDGCVGCHHARGPGALHFRGEPAKDFAMLLRDGFFLLDDSGSLLTRIVTRDRKARMPPGARPAWTAAEAAVLRRFVEDLDRKQRK